MVIAHRTILSGLLKLAMLACVAAPSSAAVNPSDNLPGASENSVPPAVPSAQKIDWHEQPLHVRPADGSDAVSAAAATPAVLAATHTAQIARQREDMNLTSNESALQRYNLQDDEPLVSEHWWQALPGIGVALFFGIVLYMRHPIQRKRKYRRTPHEPYDRYRRPRQR